MSIYPFSLAYQHRLYISVISSMLPSLLTFHSINAYSILIVMMPILLYSHYVCCTQIKFCICHSQSALLLCRKSDTICSLRSIFKREKFEFLFFFVGVACMLFVRMKYTYVSYLAEMYHPHWPVVSQCRISNRGSTNSVNSFHSANTPLISIKTAKLVK